MLGVSCPSGDFEFRSFQTRLGRCGLRCRHEACAPSCYVVDLIASRVPPRSWTFNPGRPRNIAAPLAKPDRFFDKPANVNLFPLLSVKSHAPGAKVPLPGGISNIQYPRPDLP